MTSARQFMRELDKLRKEVRGLATTPSLSRSSIDGGALEIRDDFGNTTGYVGQQYDGTFTIASVGGTYPSSPTVPMATPVQGGLRLYWDGTYEDGSVTRMDFKRVTFHAVTDVNDLDILSPSQIVGEITVATGGEIVASLPPVEYFVFAVAWTESGKFSAESVAAFGTPLSLVDDTAFQGVQSDIEAVTEATGDTAGVFRQVAQPTVEAGRKAIWFDTDNGNVPSYFDGTDWSLVEFGATALAANAVIAETIAVGALDGKTITGALVQTVSAPDAGIKIVDNSLVAFDAAGDPSLLVDGDTGGITMVGPALVGGSITAPLFETDPTPDRGIKIVGSILTAYDGAGVESLIANGNDGSLTLNGPAISSASITGSILKTQSTGERIEIGVLLDEFDDLTSQINFYSGHTSDLKPSNITVDVIDEGGGAVVSYLQMKSAAMTGSPRRSLVQLSTGTGTPLAVPGIRLIGAEQAYLATDDSEASLFLDKAGKSTLRGIQTQIDMSATGSLTVRDSVATTPRTVATLAFAGSNFASPLTVGGVSVLTDSASLSNPTLESGVVDSAEGTSASLMPGGLVDLNIAFSITSTKAAGTALLAMPTALKPKTRVRIPLYYPAANAATGIVNTYLETDGKLYCYAGLGVGEAVYGHATYRIA